jgi:hypothetical protein
MGRFGFVPIIGAEQAMRKHLTDKNPGRVRLALEGGDALQLRLSLDLALLSMVMEVTDSQLKAEMK